MLRIRRDVLLRRAKSPDHADMSAAQPRVAIELRDRSAPADHFAAAVHLQTAKFRPLRRVEITQDLLRTPHCEGIAIGVRLP